MRSSPELCEIIARRTEPSEATSTRMCATPVTACLTPSRRGHSARTMLWPRSRMRSVVMRGWSSEGRYYCCVVVQAPTTSATLQDHHRIAIRIEAVPLIDCLPVGPHRQLVSRERGDEHHEGGAGKMEIRDQFVHGAEAIGRTNEQACFSRSLGKGSVIAHRALEGARTRRADGPDRPARAANVVQRRGRFRWYVEALLVHDVLRG